MSLPHFLNFNHIGHFTHDHVHTIAYAMATTMIVVIAVPLNAFISRSMKGWHFIIRTLVFVLLFTVCYPILDHYTEGFLQRFLGKQDSVALISITILAFVAFGFWAQKQKNIH